MSAEANVPRQKLLDGRFYAKAQGPFLFTRSKVSPCPSAGIWAPHPAFAIGPTAGEEQPKADCHTRKESKQRTRGR